MQSVSKRSQSKTLHKQTVPPSACSWSFHFCLLDCLYWVWLSKILILNEQSSCNRVPAKLKGMLRLIFLFLWLTLRKVLDNIVILCKMMQQLIVMIVLRKSLTRFVMREFCQTIYFVSKFFKISFRNIIWYRISNIEYTVTVSDRSLWK